MVCVSGLIVRVSELRCDGRWIGFRGDLRGVEWFLVWFWIGFEVFERKEERDLLFGLVAMDLFLQKARYFAQETAKKSQEIAMEAAKLSQDLAQETAKRSRELSHDFVIEATKKADQIKTLANEISPAIVGRAIPDGAVSPTLAPSEQELEEFGITPELREFVKGLTIRTFRDFPLEESNCEFFNFG